MIDNLGQTVLDVPSAPRRFREVVAAARAAGLIDDSLQAPEDDQLADSLPPINGHTPSLQVGEASKGLLLHLLLTRCV